MPGGQSSCQDTPQSHASHTFSLFTPVIVFSLDSKVQPKLILETSSSNVIVSLAVVYSPNLSITAVSKRILPS